MQKISPLTRSRITDFITHGGQPLAYWEMRIARRALAVADGNAEDAVALILAA